MNQKGFSFLIFIVIIFILSTGIIGGSFVIKNNVNNYKATSTSTTSSIASLVSTKQVPSPSPTNQPIPHAYLMRGKAMLPDYTDGQIWLYDKYESNKPKRFDVVVLKNPTNMVVIIMKRIIGLPNEKIKIVNKEIYINDNKIDETKYHLTPDTVGGQFVKENQEYIIPENSYFILGDNRAYSSDSREYGPVTIDIIIGKITNQIQKIDITEEKCNCWDSTNNLCLPQLACQ